MSYFLPADGAVLAASRGLVLTHPHIGLVDEPLYLWSRTRNVGRQVGLVSGGGSGHEPLHIGLLGPGGLDAVAPGHIFASPHHRQIIAASRTAAGRGGVLHIVKNYTGDRINFGIAAERLNQEGIRCARVLVDDDLATSSSGTGARGTAGVVVVEQLLGAAADRGADLDSLTDLGARISSRTRSLSVAARAQTSPVTRRPVYDTDRLEFGVGIHGERAATTVDADMPLQLLVRRMLTGLLDAVPSDPVDGMLLVVNGLGGTSSLELHIITTIAHGYLAERGVRVAALTTGTYTAALDMAGFSLTLTSLEAGWLDLWQNATQTPLRMASSTTASTIDVLPVTSTLTPVTPAPPTRGPRVVLDLLSVTCDRVHADLTLLDERSGDGDFGDSFTGGVRRALALSTQDGSAGMHALATTFLDTVGGTSGPLFGLLFEHLAPVTDAADLDTENLAHATAAALDTIRRVGGARPKDRTLVDALTPASTALRASAGRADALTEAAAAAFDGARATADMLGRAGRSSYVGEHARGVPDPGAVAVAIIFSVLAQVFEPQHAARLTPAHHMTSLTDWTASA
ncbi:dihydroxyacetone kinase subunit DhaK [Streptomyces sp. NPDC056987]|uniref:dihydroxyacetone kinase subunit DhaK n=1 Tax=Streptomyces sp. NPDC056987 TaxID=3345988 RepID=UPI00364588D2